MNFWIGCVLFDISMAKPKTCWWERTKRGDRVDHLFSLTRIYLRCDRSYVWQFAAGRLSIFWHKTSLHGKVLEVFKRSLKEKS